MVVIMTDKHYQQITDFVWDIGNAAASHRDHPLYKWLYTLAVTYHNKYENLRLLCPNCYLSFNGMFHNSKYFCK